MKQIIMHDLKKEIRESLQIAMEELESTQISVFSDGIDVRVKISACRYYDGVKNILNSIGLKNHKVDYRYKKFSVIFELEDGLK